MHKIFGSMGFDEKVSQETCSTIEYSVFWKTKVEIG